MEYDLTISSMCFSTALFAYVGVEVVAATVPESERPIQTESPISSNGVTFKFSAIWISSFAMALYTVCGYLLTLNVPQTECRLPRPVWLDRQVSNCTSTTNTTIKASSAFVLVAEIHDTSVMRDVFNIFLLFTALTCANTNLFVASRTLFGMAGKINKGKPFFRVISYFGEVNSYGVPIRAVWLSAIFLWCPFLQLLGYHNGSQESSTNIPMSNSVTNVSPKVTKYVL